jgi:hypothetical protein
VAAPTGEVPAPASDGADADTGRAGRVWSKERAALAVFAVAVVAEAALVVVDLGRDRWFMLDEWDFLADRTAGDLDDLFRDHGGHWVTLPVLAYRAMWNVFGFDYTGYLVVVVAFGIATVSLVRIVMRRCGVGPWIATITPLGLLLFGAGEDNIVWAFQIAFLGALVFGFVHLVLLDHDGPIDRRDWLGLGAGVLALMFSGVGIAMAVAAGFAALLRRGWRVAAFHCMPLAAVYVAWWLAIRPSDYYADPSASLTTRVVDFVRWVVAGVRSAFAAYGSLTGVGVLLGVLLVFGLVVAWRGLGRDELRVRAALPGAALVGGVSFLGLMAVARGGAGPEFAASGRYIFVVIVLALPALGVAADAVIRRWRIMAVPIVVLLVIGIPGNVGEFGTHFPWVKQYFVNERQQVALVPRLRDAALVPPEVLVDPTGNPGLTVGWLRDQLERGALWEPELVGQSALNYYRTRLGVAQSEGDRPEECAPFDGAVVIATRKGDVLGFRNQAIIVETIVDGQALPGSSVYMPPTAGERLTIELDDLTLRITPTEPAPDRDEVASDRPAELCR